MYLDLDMEHESDDDTICNWRAQQSLKEWNKD